MNGVRRGVQDKPAKRPTTPPPDGKPLDASGKVSESGNYRRLWCMACGLIFEEQLTVGMVYGEAGDCPRCKSRHVAERAA